MKAAGSGYRGRARSDDADGARTRRRRRMRQLIEDNDIETVWFGAAAPLALLSPLARTAGASRVIASTHGHEVGWSMLPVARIGAATHRQRRQRRHLRQPVHPRPVRIGVRSEGRARAPRRPGVDTERFETELAGRAELQPHNRLGEMPAAPAGLVTAGAAQEAGHAEFAPCRPSANASTAPPS